MSMTTIRLYGEAGRRFGRVHRVSLDRGSVAEAMAYLKTQFRGVEEYFIRAKDRGVGFAVFHGKKNIGAHSLKDSALGEEIRIAPILMGSKNGGVFSVILGAVIIAATVVLDAWTDGGFSSATGGYTYTLGIAMIAGGVIQLLSPHPRGLSSKDSANNQANYAFNGPVNTQAQGNPVGLLYGEMIVGSAVISASITAKDTAYVPTTSGFGNMGVAGNIRDIAIGG